MAYTTEQRDALQAAIASGTRVVMYDGKRIEYHDLGEMRRLLAAMNAELAPAGSAAAASGYNPIFSKGI
jgi:hypothetical protein